MRLAGKVVVVTGAGSGLGQALAKAGSLGEGLSLHPLDITDKEKVAALPEEVERVHGQVDGLINNAGIIQPFKRLLDLDEAAMERVMRVNFWGTLHMTRAFLPRLLKRPEAHLVNVSSMGAFVPVPGQALYGASKAAVMLLTEALWAELQGTPVRVTLVLPGAMRTGIAEHSGVEAPRAEGAKVPVLEPEVAAKRLLDAVERDAFRVLLGRDAQTMDLLYRLSPRRMAHLLTWPFPAPDEESGKPHEGREEKRRGGEGQAVAGKEAVEKPEASPGEGASQGLAQGAGHGEGPRGEALRTLWGEGEDEGVVRRLEEGPPHPEEEEGEGASPKGVEEGEARPAATRR